MYDDMMITARCSGRVKTEALLRLDIIKKQGLSEHLDVKSLMSKNNVLCASKREDVFGEPIGLVVPADKVLDLNRFSAIRKAFHQNDIYPYFFLIGDINSNNYNHFSLFISSDESKWEAERKLLTCKLSPALLCDTSNYSMSIVNVEYSIFHGGPIIIKSEPKV